MKIPMQGEIRLIPNNLPESSKQELLQDKSPRYLWIALSTPIRQIGHDFPFAVVPMQLSPEIELRQCGRGVLCQTEAEAKESVELLSQRAKQPVVIVQTAGFGSVGRVTNFQCLIREQSVRHRLAIDGQKIWYALERDIDKATGEVKVIRRVETDSEQKAIQIAKEWLHEYELQKSKFLDAAGKIKPPPPPARCNRLTEADLRDDLPQAKWKALKRQWPHICELFEKQKSSPAIAISDRDCQEAYLLDLVEQGYDPKGDNIRGDLQFIAALHRAAQKFARQAQNKITDMAIYLIAFNWELGWCYLSDADIAKSLEQMLKGRFTPAQVKQYRSRTLGLVAKHWPGPPPKSP